MKGKLFSPKAALVCICVFSGLMMLYAGWTDSATNDEVIHITAGYDYIQNFTYHLNPEHPPLIKALAGIPLLLLKPNFPTSTNLAALPDLNELEVGGQFLYQSGNNAENIIRLARLVPIAITILAILAIYLLSRMLMDEWWSLLPAFLFALDPTILGNGHLVTTDVGAAFGVVTATYYFFRHLQTRSRNSLWLAGIALGVAELCKFSTIVLIPFFLLLACVWQTKRIGERTIIRDAFFIFLISFGMVYATYAMLMVRYPVSQQISDTIASLQERFGNVQGLGGVAVWMAGNPILRPFAEYFLGILMVSSRVVIGAFVYSFGRVSIGGGWWYFPAIFLLKEPIPTLIILVLGATTGLSYFIKKFVIARRENISEEFFRRAFIVCALLIFIIIYWSICIASPFDHGIRYLIPVMPFIYILASYLISIGLKSEAKFGYLALGGLLIWLVLEAIFTAPYFLSYYNEFGGGTWNGYRYATDSNYDWGQDLLRFQFFMNEHPEISSIAVGYLGRGDIHYYLGNRAIDWSSGQGSPTNSGIHWFAISIDALELATQPATPEVDRSASDTYPWLLSLRPPASGMGNVPTPDYRVGTSIFIYYLK